MNDDENNVDGSIESRRFDKFSREFGEFTEANSEYFNDADERYLEAWKQGIRLVGHEYFNSTGISNYSVATDISQVLPNKEIIDRLFSENDIDSNLLILMCCLADNEYCTGLLEKMGKSFSDLVRSLDYLQRGVFKELVANIT